MEHFFYFVENNEEDHSLGRSVTSTNNKWDITFSRKKKKKKEEKKKDIRSYGGCAIHLDFLYKI